MPAPSPPAAPASPGRQNHHADALFAPGVRGDGGRGRGRCRKEATMLMQIRDVGFIVIGVSLTQLILGLAVLVMFPWRLASPWPGLPCAARGATRVLRWPAKADAASKKMSRAANWACCSTKAVSFGAIWLNLKVRQTARRKGGRDRRASRRAGRATMLCSMIRVANDGASTSTTLGRCRSGCFPRPASNIPASLNPFNCAEAHPTSTRK